MSVNYLQYLNDDSSDSGDSSDSSDDMTEINVSCLHESSRMDTLTNYEICIDCGIIINKNVKLLTEISYDGKKTNYGNNYINPHLPKSSSGISMNLQKQNSTTKNSINIHRNNKMPYFEKTLYSKIEEFKTHCYHYEVDFDIISKGVNYLVKISKIKYLTGKNEGKYIIFRSGIILLYVYCLFRACQNLNKPKTNEDIALIFGIDKIRVNKALKDFNKIVKKYNLDIINNNIHPNEYVNAFCEHMNMSNFCKEFIKIMIERILLKNIAMNKKDISIVAGSIRLFMNQFKVTFITSEYISKVSCEIYKNTCVKTVENTFLLLLEKRHEILPTRDELKYLIDKYHGQPFFTISPKSKSV